MTADVAVSGTFGCQFLSTTAVTGSAERMHGQYASNVLSRLLASLAWGVLHGLVPMHMLVQGKLAVVSLQPCRHAGATTHFALWLTVADFGGFLAVLHATVLRRVPAQDVCRGNWELGSVL